MPASKKKPLATSDEAQVSQGTTTESSTLSDKYEAAEAAIKETVNTMSDETNININGNGTNGANGNSDDVDMSGFVVNFEDIPDRQEVPNGRYPAVITHAKPGISQAGLPKMDVRWKIEDGGDQDGEVVFDTVSFSPKARWRVKALLLALGFPKTFNEQVTPDLLIGERAVITTAIEESTTIDPNTGEPYAPRARVKGYARIGSQVSAETILARR